MNNIDWQTVITISVLIMNVVIFLTIKINDMKHLEKEFKKAQEDITKKIDKIFRRLGKVEKATIIQQAVCDERHGKSRLRRQNKKKDANRRAK